MALKVGARLKSAVCSTEVIIVRAPKDDIALSCGGVEMYLANAEAPSGAPINPAFSGGTALGKRYSDDELGLEVLATKAGDGTLSVGETPLPMKEAKNLPTSD